MIFFSSNFNFYLLKDSMITCDFQKLHELKIPLINNKLTF